MDQADLNKESCGKCGRIQLTKGEFQNDVIEVNNPELEHSLTLAAEIGTALLNENEGLKQELHDIKYRKLTLESELEEEIIKKDKLIKELKRQLKNDEEEKIKIIKSFENKLKILEEQKEAIIYQAEDEREELKLKLYEKNNFCTKCTIYKDELQNILSSIKSLEATIEILQKDNEELQSKVSYTDKHGSVCLNCFPPPSDCDLTNNSDFTTVVYKRRNSKVSECVRNARGLQNVTCSQDTLETCNPFDILSSTDEQESICHDKEGSDKVEPMEHKRMLLLADSHGRDLAWNLNKHVKKYEAYGFIKPGGRAAQVLNQHNIEGEKLNSDDILVISCGTNDVARNEGNTMIDIVSNRLKNYKKSKVVLIDLPNRYDLASWSCVNAETRRVNIELKILCDGLENVTLVEASKADRQLHTRHGMHFNNKGKQWLVQKICEAVARMDGEQSVFEETSVSLHGGESEEHTKPPEEEEEHNLEHSSIPAQTLSSGHNGFLDK
ncbi:hypothetical protein J6590_007945 [Homalodisca vitripennis]|nr:hypothetical protein J6590_007945 [Homalodisca vitripennis]